MKKKSLLLIAFVTASGCLAWGQVEPLQQSMKRGKLVYMASCASCHMPQGAGVIGTIPPLTKNATLKNQIKLIGIVLEGLEGEIIVNGKKYNGSMAELNYLEDREIADVLNFVSNSWGNKNPPITPAQVNVLR